MDELVIFPWWKSIDRTHPGRELRIGRWKIYPFERDTETSFPPRIAEIIRRLLKAYVTPQNRPISACTVAKIETAEWLAPLREDFDTDNLVTVVTTAGLATRRFFQDGLRYSTAAEFEGQCWSNAANAEGITYSWRRKDGNGLGYQPLNHPGLFRFPLPHFPGVHQDLDWELANALHPAIQAPVGFSSDLVSALHCFNLANTDHPTTPLAVELTLLSGAFDRLIGGSQGHRREDAFVDGMKRLRAQAGPVPGQLPGHRVVGTPGVGDTAFDIWARDFYRARGDLAHGRQRYNRQRAWLPEEHVLLASSLFPLLLRMKLLSSGHLSQRYARKGELSAFEGLLPLRPLDPEHEQDQEAWREAVVEGCSRDLAARIRMRVRQRTGDETHG